MKPFLIIQLRPEDDTADDEFEAFLTVSHLREKDVVRIRAEQERIANVHLDEYSGIIVGGSPFDISANEKSRTQLRVESEFKALFDRVIPEDFPFFGACSGCGLLGRFIGTSISDKYRETVKGIDVDVTKEGEKDPLLRGLPTTFRALVGHKEACDDIPEGAVLLATSTDCPVQMFRIGSNVYATQFHPEADGEIFTVRINVYKHHGYFAPEEAEELIRNVKDEETPVAKEILRRFVKRYCSAG